VAYRNHWSERGQASSVGNPDTLGRPRRSVLALGGITHMNKPLPRKGAVWRCSGFTKTRFLRVSLTSCAFLVAGILIAAYSVIAREESAVRLLLFAACCLLVACATVLFSIMTLMFYLGSNEKSEDEKPIS
jgi:hypothetical protein